MEKDTINNYLFFNSDNEILTIYDPQNDEFMYPQTEEKNFEESFETRIGKMTMFLKERDSSNDTLILKKENGFDERKTNFMSSLLNIISSDDAQLIDTYNGDYNLIEYSSGRYFFIVNYLICNYYAKYIELNETQYIKIKKICDVYGYEISYVNMEDINKKEEFFENNKRYLKKLNKKINLENE